MQNLYTLIRNWRLPERIKKALFKFSKLEWRFFFILSGLLLISTLGLLQELNRAFMVEMPMRGGGLKEGILGAPRFVNPVLASSDADRDLVALVYGGLMRKTPEGSLTPDLALGYEVSSDGLTYTFTLRDDITFHDDEPVTASDVVFTITSIKDPVIKSPRKASWDGVSVEQIDEKTVKFTLRQPYSSFLENTTIGILPEHIWKDTPIELNEANMNPIGTGPFAVKRIHKQSSGIIDTFTLESFDDFTLGRPYLKTLTLRFYQTEEELINALTAGSIDQASTISPEEAKILAADGQSLKSLLLPRVFGLFFNQSQNQIFTNKSVVQAINTAIDKEAIVEEVLAGYGASIEDPLPPTTPEYYKIGGTHTLSKEERLEKASAILEKDGWKRNESGLLTKNTTDKNKKQTSSEISFEIATSNAPELAKAVDIIANDLRLLGMNVTVKTFETGNLNQLVIRPRKYDALFFGQIINHESDLFAFWHSSQRKDPGLNIAMYANAKVDKILEDAFVATKPEERVKKYAQFEEEIRKDMPAVFVYSPSFIYAVDSNLQGFTLDHITSPSDRFSSVYLWYTKVDHVWKIFADK
ncbi:MAG: ABC transporter substrate-binding protein [Candidatus Paceibacteria bacterium]